MIQISFRTQDPNIRQAQSRIQAKNYSWSTIQSVFKIRQSARLTAKIHNPCDFWGQIPWSESLFTPLMERDTCIFRSFMAARLSIKLLCSQAPKVAKLWDSLYIRFEHCSFVTFLVFYNDSQHWPRILKHYSWWCYFSCNANTFCSTALSTGYFVDVSLAIY